MEGRDVDPGDGRDETINERMDRNWNELLQEMRVTQTGTQILSGFLLTIAFQPTFHGLPAFDKTVYLFLVLAATVTTALALAPVHLHRTLFRHHSKPALVQIGHLLLRAALTGVLRATAPFVYVRLHGPDHDHLYGGSYSEADLGWWADRIREWRCSDKDVWVYFNNDGAGHAVRNANRLRALLAR
ncbi:DUF6328 family protein [Microlunatus ginsengisoli]